MSDPIFKAVYLTDTHNKGVSPSSRLDDYPSALLEKQEWAVQFAIDHDVHAILHGGDWFDSFDTGHKVVRAVQDVYYKASRSGIPVIGTFGSHDVHGYEQSTITRSALGSLEGSRFVRILRRGEHLIINRVAITSVPHYFGLDEDDHGYEIDPVPGADYTILLAHGTLVEHTLPDGFDHTLIQNAKVNADLVLSGDYHPGYPVHVREDHVVFCNPGALARTKAIKHDRERIPSIVYLEVYGSNVPPMLQIVPVAVARPGSDIFPKADVTEPPNESQVARMVEFLRKETEASRGMFDPVNMINKVPIEGEDQDIVDQARLVAIAAVQEAQGDSND